MRVMQPGGVCTQPYQYNIATRRYPYGTRFVLHFKRKL